MYYGELENRESMSILSDEYNFIAQKWPRDSCPMSSGTSTAFNEKKTNKTRTVNEQNTRKYYISKWKREKKKELALADSRITAKYDMPIGTW